MNKLTKEDYDNIVRNIAQRAAYGSDKPSIEVIAKELNDEYIKHIKSNYDFVENIEEAYDYYIVSTEHTNYYNPKFERAFKLFLNDCKNTKSIKPIEIPRPIKLRWNGNSNQLYYLLKQLTELKTINDLPYLKNTAEELAFFIENYVEGINAKSSSIKSEIVRKTNIPRKGKRLIIQVK